MQFYLNSYIITILNLTFATISKFAELYSILIVIRLSLSWLPKLNAFNEPYATLYGMVDPYLKFFRGMIPHIFGMDLSPVLALLFLQNIVIIFEHIHIDINVVE